MEKKILMLLAASLFTIMSASSAFAVSWIDWTSLTYGTITTGETTTNVSMTSPAISFVNGDNYYNNAYTGFTAESGTYGGYTPSDLIQINPGGTVTITFDNEVLNPYIALVSVGRIGTGVTYSFDDSFTVLSSGANYWSYGGYSVDGSNFTGYEYNGILQFSGVYSSITFDIAPSEFWHGFNFGIEDVAPVPEPSTIILLCSGLIGLFAARRKFGVK